VIGKNEIFIAIGPPLRYHTVEETTGSEEIDDEQDGENNDD
jgi:hypothetical protein